MSKVALIILDGYGIGNQDENNAIWMAKTPVMDKLMAECPNTKLSASGLDVGLPDGQMGNSEVGHMNIGGGRVVFQPLPRITKAIEDGDFFRNDAYIAAMDAAKAEGKALHILGLLSDGGVHSHIKHIEACVKMAKERGLENVYLHCFLDGRDVPPTSGAGYVKQLDDFCKELGCGKIATIQGRFYGMDRDKRWDRVETGYNAITLGEGVQDSDPVHSVEASYADGVTDEFVKPVVCAPEGVVNAGDAVIFMNFRPDRAREMTYALSQADFDGFERKKVVCPLHYVCTARYDEKLADLPVAFPPVELKNTLGEIASEHGLKQLRIAETEKYAHVTFFFNGGTETQYEGEDRCLIPSPKEFPTYDLIPQMSAIKVKDELITRMKSGAYDMVICNFANCDMVGHTGVMSAAITAVETVDACLGEIVAAAEETGFRLLITADHGNADRMVEADGSTNTAHTTNLVPLVLVGEQFPLRPLGKLADLAPTMLDMMGIEQPAEMTGESLIVKE